MKPSLACLTLLLTLAALSARAATLPESAKIDEIIAKEWQKNNLTPNAAATDDVFLRRIYVDVAGRIPTADEARVFIASQDKDKRARLIDQLLAQDTTRGLIVEGKKTDAVIETVKFQRNLTPVMATSIRYYKAR